MADQLGKPTSGELPQDPLLGCPIGQLVRQAPAPGSAAAQAVVPIRTPSKVLDEFEGAFAVVPTAVWHLAHNPGLMGLKLIGNLPFRARTAAFIMSFFVCRFTTSTLATFA